MADEQPKSVLDATLESLQRVQTFNTTSLSRRDALGTTFAFDAAIEPANKAIDLFNRLPLEALPEFPDGKLNSIKQQADALYNLFEQIRTFDPEQQNAVAVKNDIITKIEQSYDGIFNDIFPFISYSVARTVDFNKLETEGRAVIQEIRDQTDEVTKEIGDAQSKATSVLEEIERTAAEQGVSQQAHYFATEATNQETEAGKWRNQTIGWAIALIAYGALSFFFHKIPWLSPENVTEAIGFTASKILIFAVLSYMLILSARNFLSHKHNVVVNKHRQNALQTFNALVDAARSPATQDIVLNHAAACIFAPQESGYIKPGSVTSSGGNMPIELLPRVTSRVDEGS